MGERYDKCIDEWNSIFSKESSDGDFTKSSSGNEDLDKGIKWIAEGTENILDFGCGNGSMLFLCAMNGSKYNVGIDLSQSGIKIAKTRSKQMNEGNFDFIQGSIDVLKNIGDSFFDAVILSNIIDNLYPNDAEELIREIGRILKEDGKVLVKVNSYITKEKIEEDKIKVIDDNLLDDGLILLNKTTDEWKKFFERKFNIKLYSKVYYPEYDTYNRMFCLIKKF